MSFVLCLPSAYKMCELCLVPRAIFIRLAGPCGFPLGGGCCAPMCFSWSRSHPVLAVFLCCQVPSEMYYFAVLGVRSPIRYWHSRTTIHIVRSRLEEITLRVAKIATGDTTDFPRNVLRSLCLHFWECGIPVGIQCVKRSDFWRRMASVLSSLPD